MEPLSREERKAIVKNELNLLKEEKYISAHMYAAVIKAHQRFYENLNLKEQKIQQAPIVEKPKKQIRKVKEKRKLTAEQIRERHITWLLNLGVILLLIGGLYLATSNWETMSSWTKAGSIGLISILFYGIAFASKSFLKIDKTAFSFLVLGSLFLPIFLLSIGWFQLIGRTLSIFGEGRYFFGMLSSFAVLPVYILHARKLSSRLFVWFSYIALTIGIGFFFRAVRFEEDGFFFSMMLFQMALIFLYHKTKGYEKLKIFTKEFIYFAQFNLILTSILMLGLYHSHLFLGFNLILTGVIYLSMVYVTGRKEYHFVFSTMLVYGVYQMVQFSILDELSPLLFAALGFVFLLVPKVLDDQYPWKKIFTVTSGVISSLAFLFITFEALLIRWGDPTVTIFLAYLTIAGNFLYLSNTTNKLLFRYLTSVFLSISFFEGLLLMDKVVTVRPFLLFVFLIGFIMFFLFGILLKGRFLASINQSARDIGWFYMGVSSYAAATLYAWWELGVMLGFIAMAAYVSIKKETRKMMEPLFQWLVPISLGTGTLALIEEWRHFSLFFNTEFGVATQCVLASLVLLAIYFMVKNKTLRQNFFYCAEVLYTIGLIAAIISPINEQWLRPLLFVGGIGMYVLLYQFTKMKLVSYLISVVTLVTYFTLLDSQGEIGNLQYMIGAILLFGISWLIKKRDQYIYQAFAFTGHLYMPIAFLLTLFIYGREALWSFLIGLIIYGISTKVVEAEWKKKLFLYSAFTSLFAVSSLSISYLESISGGYAYLITSAFITIFWLRADSIYKKRTIVFLVPFSLLGVLSFMSVYPYEMVPFLVTLLYSIGILVLLHLCKWEFLTVIPTLLIYSATMQYLLYQPFAPVNELITLAVFGIMLLLAGKWFFTSLFEKEKTFTVDVYSIGALLFFASMYLFEQPVLWTKVLPGMFIALTFWLQRGRVSLSVKWLPTFLAGGYLLQPYYALVNDLQIHELLLKEVYVLPLIVLGIYLSVCLKGKYEKITRQLQWGILLVVATVLVIDGLETSTIYDALILGTLSLLSILAGVFLRLRSYFFVGTAVLLLNVFLQTRPFWGNLPWWAYLLIAGSILIGVASSNEWNKQKTAKGESTLFSKWKDKIIEMWKQWK